MWWSKSWQRNGVHDKTCFLFGQRSVQHVLAGLCWCCSSILFGQRAEQHVLIGLCWCPSQAGSCETCTASQWTLHVYREHSLSSHGSASLHVRGFGSQVVSCCLCQLAVAAAVSLQVLVLLLLLQNLRLLQVRLLLRVRALCSASPSASAAPAAARLTGVTDSKSRPRSMSPLFG